MSPERPVWAELEAQRAELEAEQAHLVATVEQMDPAVGARALRVLADRFEELEKQYRVMRRDGEGSGSVTRRGNPSVVVRLEPDVMDELRERAGGTTAGRAGGIALVVRRIIYEYLGRPLPTQHGDLERSSAKRKPSGKKRGWPKGKPRKPAEGAGPS